MKAITILTLTAVILSSCNKEELVVPVSKPVEKKTNIRFQVIVYNTDLLTVVPTLKISGDLHGKPFSTTVSGTESSVDLDIYSDNDRGTFNFKAESNIPGQFHINVFVNNKLSIEYGSPCAATQYSREGDWVAFD